MLPFKETREFGNAYLRIFSGNVKESELKWHWDEEERVIYPLKETDWMFQYDNRLPIPINSEIKIPKGVWHRIIKGTGDLHIIVEKHRDI